MKKAKQVILVLFAVFLVSGCASAPLPEPGERNQTLVVGMMDIRGITELVSHRGIIISLSEIITGRIYAIQTTDDGLFYSANVPPGTYRFTRMEYPRITGGFSSITLNSPRRIDIREGYVNNIGTILWTNIDDTTIVRGNFSYNRDYAQVINKFQSRYSSSGWNEREWVNNLFSF